MKSLPPRIALMGVGFHGFSAVVPALLSMADRLELCAVLEPWETNRARFADAYSGIPVFTTAAELYAIAKPDIVYIATLPHLHAPLALEAFAAGCHVICEKPLAPTVGECANLVEAAEQAGRHLVTMFENRYKTHHRRIREWALSGRLGSIEAVHLQHLWPGPLWDPRRRDLLDASGALDCGIHYLDLARFFVDGGDWAYIHALGRWFDEPHLKFPPHIAIQATLAGGPLVTLEDSMSFRLKNGRRVNDRSMRSSIFIVGTEGTIESQPDNSVKMLLSDGTEETCAADGSTHVEELPWVLDDFLFLLKTGASKTGFLPDGRDGLIAQRIVAEANNQAVARRR